MSPEQRPRKAKTSIEVNFTLHPNEAFAKQLPLPPPFTPHAAADDESFTAREPLTIFTAGHSNHDAEMFLALLLQHGLQTLVDVRSAPYSRYSPQFNRNALQAMLEDAGIRYVWAGEQLGGRPDDPTCYRHGVIRRGEVDYDVMAKRPWYRLGVAQLMAIAADGPTVVMCSEEDPRRCHRHRLIERSLRAEGTIVLHIRHDGSLETIEAENTESVTTVSPQISLPGFDA